jgi:hypothetical protein
MGKITHLKDVSPKNNIFKFEPLQYVYINVYGIRIEGRVHRCILSQGKMPFYDVEFLDQGIFKMREFYVDVLEARK